MFRSVGKRSEGVSGRGLKERRSIKGGLEEQGRENVTHCMGADGRGVRTGGTWEHVEHTMDEAREHEWAELRGTGEVCTGYKGTQMDGVQEQVGQGGANSLRV